MKVVTWFVGILLCGIVAVSDPLVAQLVGKQPAGAVILKRTQHFIEIEAPLDRVWFGCDPTGKSGNAFLVFYVLDGDESHQFLYRRAQEVTECMKTEREYRQVLGKAKTIRLVGSHPDLEAGSRTEKKQRAPVRFTSAPKLWSWYFARMQAEGRCKAYFDHHCDLPKNYWAGVIPE